MFGQQVGADAAASDALRHPQPDHETLDPIPPSFAAAALPTDAGNDVGRLLRLRGADAESADGLGPVLGSLPAEILPGMWGWGGPATLLAVSLVCLLAYACAAFLRECLWHSVPSRVAEAAGESQRERIESVLADGERIALAAGLLVWTAALGGFSSLTLALNGSGVPVLTSMLTSAAVTVAVTAAFGEALAPAFAASRGDRWLARWLPAAAVLSSPLHPLAAVFLRLEQFVRNQFDLPRAEHARRIVEDLRDTIEDSEIEGDLGETSREIIENVIELQDVDAAAVMTPRTEMCAVPKSATLREALRIAAEVGHGRLPVYDDSLDSICGTFTAREGLSAAAAGELDETPIASLVRPAIFVPETKRVTELIGELRQQRNKLAVVLDEYGGTAGIVTMSDILTELVGELPDEFDEAETEGIRRLPEGGFEIDASERVSDVNEALELELPEDADYETIGGFVLAHLGRFPLEGESFDFERLTVQVTRASDRRVLEVRVLPAAEQPA